MRCFLFFSHILHPKHSFPFLTFLPLLKSVTLSSLLPQTFPHSISPQKRAGLPETSNKHGLTSYNKIRHIRSYQDWIRQPRRGKSFPKADKRGRALIPLLGIPQKTLSYIVITYAEDIGQTPTNSLISGDSMSSAQLIL